MRKPDGYQGGSVGLMMVLIIVCAVLPVLAIIGWCLRRRWEDKHLDRIKYVNLFGRKVRQSTLVGAVGAAHLIHQAHNHTIIGGGAVQDMHNDNALNISSHEPLMKDHG
jgi:hypothetical protein